MKLLKVGVYLAALMAATPIWAASGETALKDANGVGSLLGATTDQVAQTRRVRVDQGGNLIVSSTTVIQSSSTAVVDQNWNAVTSTVTTTETTYDVTGATPIKSRSSSVVNDGPNDVLVGFDGSTTVKSVTLHTGESATVDLAYETLFIKTTSGTATFRVLATW